MPNISRYDTFNDVLDNLFHGFFVRPLPIENQPRAQSIKIEVAEQENAYKVLAEIPGVNKEDIQVTIDGATVSISAETKREKEVKNGGQVVHSERYYGKVARSFQLAQELDQSKVEAKYTNGVLELVLPKKATASARQITIQ